MATEATAGALHAPPGEGEAVWVVENTYTFKARGADTDGTLAAFEASAPPGTGPPPHVHTGEDEAYYLLDGQLDVLGGDATFTARAGSFVFIPRGTLHSFENATHQPVRMLVVVTPAGFEEFFREVGTPARPGEQPPPADQAELDRTAALADDYGMELHPPEDR